MPRDGSQTANQISEWCRGAPTVTEHFASSSRMDKTMTDEMREEFGRMRIPAKVSVGRAEEGWLVNRLVGDAPT
jgi:hypothetical protein